MVAVIGGKRFWIWRESQWGGLADSDEFKAADKNYIQVPTIISMTGSAEVKRFEGGDFSPSGIEARAAEGVRAAREAIAHPSYNSPAGERLAPPC
jgi:hypothetical protein